MQVRPDPRWLVQLGRAYSKVVDPSKQCEESQDRATSGGAKTSGFAYACRVLWLCERARYVGVVNGWGEDVIAHALQGRLDETSYPDNGNWIRPEISIQWEDGCK